MKLESSTKAQTKYDDDVEHVIATIFLYLLKTIEQYVRNLQDLVIIWAKLKEVFATIKFAAHYNI
jgi:hypothetical protein